MGKIFVFNFFLQSGKIVKTKDRTSSPATVSKTWWGDFSPHFK